MTEFADLFSTLEDPRAGNARRHSRHDRHPGDRLWRHALRRPDRRRYGTFRPRQTGSPAIILPETGQRHPQPRYKFQAPGYAGSRRFPAAVHRLYVLDVTCHEDQARNRKGHCAENLALLRKLALNLARLEASKSSMRGQLKRAGWDDGYLVSIRSQFTKIHMR